MEFLRLEEGLKFVKERDKSCYHLRDDIPNLGPGMFVTDRDQVSFDRAYALVVTSFEKVPSVPEDDAWLQKYLLAAVQAYWADHAYDNRTTMIDLRPEIVVFRRALGKVTEAIEELSVDGRAMLWSQMRQKTGPGGEDPVELLKAQITILNMISEPVASIKGKKGPLSKESVVNCCSRLCDIRERLTGQPFAASFAPKREHIGNATSRFARPDAQFTLEVMQAIDGSVTFSQVLDGLKRRGKSLSRQK